MSDEQVALLLLGIVLCVPILIIRAAYSGAKGVVQRHRESKEDARAGCERRALELLEEFPEMTDLDVGTLLNDEAVNKRLGGEWLRWATPETVGRMRRTVMVARLRRRR
jgi:hypothetical protein